ncbi:unnamed protein product [Cladocopium goreaui]|uniref:Uncharacterized protein n=1 Tax=Cladocopium goreaui TaxID=2562237 RepID=A0A9P1DK17_9DINO|nr:unnamed protein product [Cladocopium goreaui]
MRLEEQGTSVLKDLGCSLAKTDHQRESKEHSPANQAGDVCFGEFGQGGSWGGPSALEDLRCSADKTEYQREKGGPPETARSTAKQTRSVLEDLGRSADKTEHQGEKGTETDEVGRAGDVRFEGFGLLTGQNGPPEGEQGAQPSKPSWRRLFWRIWAGWKLGRSVRFGGFALLSGQNGVPERERSTEAQPQETGGHITKDQLGKPALRNFGGSLTKAGHLKQQGAPPSKPGLGELGRSVLQDLGR